MANLTSNLTSSEWNVILRHQRSPLITVTILLFLIGFVGNLSVIIVYKLRLKKSDGRYFIPYLAIADLSAATVTSLFMMIMDFTEGLFPSDELCKAFQFLNWSTSQTAVFLLFVIAVHPYLSVCRPLNLGFTRLLRRVAIGLSVAFAYLLGLPLIAFSGRVKLNVRYKEWNVTGYICTFNPGINEHGEAIYYNILFVGSILLLIATTGLYIPVGRIVFLRMKERKRSVKTNNLELSSRTVDSSQDALSPSQTGSTLDGCSETAVIASADQRESNLEGKNSSSVTMLQGQTKSNLDGNTDSAVNATSGANSAIVSATNSVLNNNASEERKPSTDLSNDNRRNAKKASSKRRQQKTYNVRGKFTVTLMLVVLFYVISYIPFYVIVSTGINDPNVWFNLPPWKLNGSLFLYRCYIINNVVNPIIYGMFDSTFRRHLVDICKRILFK